MGWLTAMSPRVRGLLIIIIGVVIMLAAVSIWLARRDRQTIRNHDAATTAKVEKSGRSADAAAMRRMITRDAEMRVAREEFNDASNAIPNEGLTRRQRLDLCIELRDAGTDTRILPECADLHAGAPPSARNHHPAER